MAAVDRRSFEDVDVFTIPHCRMKHLLTRATKQVKCTDFSNIISFSSLLTELSSTFLEIKQHEEIENKYIMKILKRKLQGEALKKLLVHLHAHSHISDILNQVRKTEQKFKDGVVIDMKVQAKKLNEALEEFFEEYVPHMTEEEQVLQPMLMEFLSPSELRQIKDVVLQLHHLKELDEKMIAVEKSFQLQFGCLNIQANKNHVTPAEQVERKENFETHALESLPLELLSSIFSCLGPKDLCHCAQVNTTWNELAFSGILWTTLHPTRWGTGDWRFGNELTSDDCNCDCEPNYDLMTFKDYSSDDRSSDKQSEYDSASDNEDYLNGQVKKETRILNGLSRYVLPKVGKMVKTLVLECSKAITNGLLFRILSQCRQLEYIDVSQTIVSDLGLMGLFKDGCHTLKYIDVSGCKNITDKVLVKLSAALGKNINSYKQKHEMCQQKCLDEDCCVKNKLKNSRTDASSIRQLETLRLSGCFKITNVGLGALSKYGGLPQLRHLDLSGCVNITAGGIQSLVSKCPQLNLNELYYCDNILEGPYADVSGGCQNNGCLNRVCCRSGRE